VPAVIVIDEALLQIAGTTGVVVRRPIVPAIIVWAAISVAATVVAVIVIAAAVPITVGPQKQSAAEKAKCGAAPNGAVTAIAGLGRT